MQQSARRLDLDRAKGVAILLVVFGHIVARGPPEGNNWYMLFKVALYQFHMPFFMYLSGYVTFLSGAARLPLDTWPTLARKRAERLLLPFLIFGLAIILGKIALGPYIYVDNVPPSLGSAALDLFWHTDLSAAHSVWYMAVLFIECLLTPPLLVVLGGRTLALLALAVVLYFLPIPHVMYLDEVAEFYVFFMLGGLAAEAGEPWTRWMDRWSTLSVAALGAAVIAVMMLVSPGVLPEETTGLLLPMLVCGTISMPALHSLVRRGPLATSATLLSLGYYTFVIYLLNTPWIGLVKGLMLKVISWNGPNFFLYVPALMTVGIFAPILTKQWLLRRVPKLDQITQ